MSKNESIIMKLQDKLGRQVMVARENAKPIEGFLKKFSGITIDELFKKKPSEVTQIIDDTLVPLKNETLNSKTKEQWGIFIDDMRKIINMEKVMRATEWTLENSRDSAIVIHGLRQQMHEQNRIARVDFAPIESLISTTTGIKIDELFMKNFNEISNIVNDVLFPISTNIVKKETKEQMKKFIGDMREIVDSKREIDTIRATLKEMGIPVPKGFVPHQ